MTRPAFRSIAVLAAMLASASPSAAQLLAPGRVVAAPERTGAVVTLRTERAVVRLEFCTPGIVRVRARFAGTFRDDESIMIARHTWPDIAIGVRENSAGIEIASARLTVRVRRSDTRLTFIDAITGRVVAADDMSAGGGIRRDGQTLGARLRLSLTEQFFGFGERMDHFNWRGHSVTLDVGRGQNANHDLGAYNIAAANYCPVPFVMSTDGYALFFHTAMATTWDMGESAASHYEFRAVEDELDYYFFLGPSFRSMLAAYTDLTGRTPLLPLAAYGVNFGTYSGGTWGHEAEASQQYVVNLVRRFRDEGIPLDALHLDSTWRKFGTLGGRNATSFEWRDTGFADPPAMFATLRDLHVGLAGLHVRPRLDNGDATTLLTDAIQAGAIADTPSKNIVNFFDEKATAWWWEHAVRPKVRQGATFLKTDEGSIYPEGRLHNLFPVVYARAAYEGFERELGRRGFTLTREGYAGVQRYPYIWAGDWPSRWTFFAPVMRGGLNLALSGVSGWGHNAGGFEEVATEELYLRWTPFGFFNPVAHFLGMEHPQYKEPWRYGERALATFRRYAQLRQRLLPYIYTASHDAWATGIPVMRPLVLDNPLDARVYAIDDEFFFGDALLVAPVTKEGAAGRTVFLPPGNWIDYWSGERYAGNRTIDYAAAPDVMPLFVEAGAIIPMQPAMGYVGEKAVDPFTFDVYPSGRSSAIVYEDDGTTLDYQRGIFAETRVSCEEQAAFVTIRVAAPVGPFRIAARSYEFRVHVDHAPGAVTIGRVAVARTAPPVGGPRKTAAWWYDEAARVVVIVSARSREGVTVRIGRGR